MFANSDAEDNDDWNHHHELHPIHVIVVVVYHQNNPMYGCHEW